MLTLVADKILPSAKFGGRRAREQTNLDIRSLRPDQSQYWRLDDGPKITGILYATYTATHNYKSK